MMTYAQELERLFHRQQRSGNFLAYVDYRSYLDSHGETVETKKKDEELLGLEEGKGFVTEFTMNDGSIWATNEVYLTDDADQITFEKRYQ